MNKISYARSIFEVTTVNLHSRTTYNLWKSTVSSQTLHGMEIILPGLTSCSMGFEAVVRRVVSTCMLTHHGWELYWDDTYSFIPMVRCRLQSRPDQTFFHKIGNIMPIGHVADIMVYATIIMECHLPTCKAGSAHVVRAATNAAKLLTDVKHSKWILRRLGYLQVALPVR